ncbi:MAG TPA: DUF3303 family protein [Candidatus Dormibacteraeota bacterium]|nr:DUF3303 family protein [Candidatus Dormibacteraeota bacterium]
MGGMLLSHLSADNATANGIDIRAEAVVDNAHTLYLIVEADTRERVERFLAPFAQVGNVEVLPASPCEAVVARGSCASASASA